MNHLALGALTAVLLSSLAATQELVWRTFGQAGRHFDGWVITIDDVDGDGCEDLVAVVDGWCNATRGPGGYLWVLSGSTGALVREILSTAPSSYFTNVRPAGDFNGDGVPDIATSQFHAGGMGLFTMILSGADGTALAQFPMPSNAGNLLSNLDVNGDGAIDVIVTSREANNYWGAVFVYSHSGTLLYRLDGSPTANPPFNIGVCLETLGDVNGDGCDDFVMGCGDLTTRGATVLVSGIDGSYLQTYFGELPGDHLAYAVDSIGDLDQDGIRDFVVSNGGLGYTSRSVMQAFSTGTGQVLHQWIEPFSYYGMVISSRGIDLDGDQVPDVVAGSPWDPAPPSASGAVYYYSGRDGTKQLRIPSPNYIPVGVARIGAVTSILARPDETGWIVTSDPYGPSVQIPGCGHASGAISAYRGFPKLVDMLGPACVGNLPVAPRVGLSTLGPAGVRVHVRDAPADALSVLMIGVSTTQFVGIPLPMAIDPLGLPGCVLRTSIELMCVTTTGIAGHDLGYAGIDLPYPISITGNGWLISAQWLVLGDASTFPGSVTEAIRWRF